MCNENSLQPRTVITIIAADDNGFHATVTYEGEPEYPEFKEQREPSPGKPSNRYRASNRVQQTGTKFVSPAPPPPPPPPPGGPGLPVLARLWRDPMASPDPYSDPWDWN